MGTQPCCRQPSRGPAAFHCDSGWSPRALSSAARVKLGPGTSLPWLMKRAWIEELSERFYRPGLKVLSVTSDGILLWEVSCWATPVHEGHWETKSLLGSRVSYNSLAVHKKRKFWVTSRVLHSHPGRALRLLMGERKLEKHNHLSPLWSWTYHLLDLSTSSLPLTVDVTLNT